MKVLSFCLIFAFFSPLFLELHAAEPLPKELEKVAINPKLGSKIDLSTPFVDSEGKERKLGEYFDGKRPVALLMSYYSCPMLCGVMINGAKDAFQNFEWLLGDKYQVLTISINHREKAELAKAKKESVFEDWSLAPEAKKAWSFLVGKKENSRKLADEIGFSYTYVPETKEYAHGAGIFFFSPEGKLTRFLPGVMFESLDLKLSLLEASKGKIGSFADKILMYCFNYNPKKNKYTIFATRLMKTGGALIVFLMASIYLLIFIRRKKSQKI